MLYAKNTYFAVILITILFTSCGPSAPEGTKCELYERDFYENKGADCTTVGPVKVTNNETESEIRTIGVGMGRLVSKDVEDFDESYDSEMNRMIIFSKSYDETFLLGKEVRANIDGDTYILDEEAKFGIVTNSQNFEPNSRVDRLITIDVPDEILYRISISDEIDIKIGGVYISLPNNKISNQAAFVYNKSM